MVVGTLFSCTLISLEFTFLVWKVKLNSAGCDEIWRIPTFLEMVTEYHLISAGTHTSRSHVTMVILFWVSPVGAGECRS